jgi:hypothetical protein
VTPIQIAKNLNKELIKLRGDWKLKRI